MLPNIISILRIFLLLPILFFLYDNQNLVAFFIFIVGCFTDFLDGFIARLFNQESLLGENLDLLADKIFVSTLFMYIPFHFDNFIFLLGGIIIIIRELLYFILYYTALNEMGINPKIKLTLELLTYNIYV